MKLISFDQALGTTGYSIFENGRLVYYNKFTTSNGETAIRLREFKDFINKLFDEYEPNKVCFEEIQLQNNLYNNVETFKKLAYVQAILMEALEERGIPFEIISSNTWKSFCNIKGRTRAEQKKNAQLFVEENYKIKVIQDIADSICLGQCALNREINWG